MRFLFFLFIYLQCSYNLIAHDHKIDVVHFNSHSYICFDEKFFIHDPDCSKCATNPKVIFKAKSPDIPSEESPSIIMPLNRSPFYQTYFPGLYYWMED